MIVTDSNVTVVRVAQGNLQDKHRQRQEPLQIIEEDLEHFFEKQGCVIQKTIVDIITDQNVHHEKNGFIVNNINKRDANYNNFNSNDVVTEQVAKITLIDDTSNQISCNEVTVNKGFIVDQNVGVSGEVFMVTPQSGDPKRSECISPSAKRSPTVVYIGTIEENEEDQLIKSVDIIRTIDETDSGPSSITLSFYENSPTIAMESCNEFDDKEDDSKENGIKHKFQEFPEEKPLSAPALLMQWQVRLPDEELQHDEIDSTLTPSSSMFSSAYTVTELGSDNSSDHSPPSESSTSTMSSRHTSEMEDGISLRHDECYLKFQEYLHLFRQLSAFNIALNLESLENQSCSSSTDDNDLNRESRQGSKKSIVFNYIPSRDQREKEEEELWVANEATYSYVNKTEENYNSDKDCKHNENNTFSSVELPKKSVSKIRIVSSKEKSSYVSPIMQAKRGSVQMTTSATQTVYSCLLPSSSENDPICSDIEKPTVNESSVGAGLCSESVLASLPSSEDQDISASHMAALLCSISTAERRHFSARQRLVDSDGKNEKQVSSDKTSSMSMLPCFEGKESIANMVQAVTSATTNQPTKRFSFLIRNNSMEQQSINNFNTSTSASDKAILEKLAELKLDDAKENISETKTNSNPSFHPACRRCQEPVYPQEKVRPSKDIMFHTSCFKCYQCGARLNLKTFYRNPLTLGDYRIFCKSHVPSLDPGKVTKDSKITTITLNSGNVIQPCKRSTTSRVCHPSLQVRHLLLNIF